MKKSVVKVCVLASLVLVMIPISARGRKEPAPQPQPQVQGELIAQQTGGVAALPANKGYASVQGILQGSCSGCHSWASSYAGISSLVVPGHPEQSSLFGVLASNRMPPGGSLPTDQKALVYSWIAAGAGQSSTPLTNPPPQGWLSGAGVGTSGGEMEGTEAGRGTEGAESGENE